MRRSPRAGLPPPNRLQEALARLSEIRATVVVAAAALRHQNCELDEDVARLLQRSVVGAISEQIERLRRL
ncbi:MAG: hypothetical protein ACYCT1_04240 [Steroidobacteraceae bacterium]|jgi:hypothetical protein